MAYLRYYNNGLHEVKTNVYMWSGTMWVRKNAYVYWDGKWNILTERFLQTEEEFSLYGFSTTANTKYYHYLHNRNTNEAGIIVAGYTTNGYNNSVSIYSGYGGYVNNYIFSNNLRPMVFREGFERELDSYGTDYRVFATSINGNHVHVFDRDLTFVRTVDVGTTANPFVTGTVEMTDYQSEHFLIWSKSNSFVRVVTTHNLRKVVDIQLTGNVLAVYFSGSVFFVMYKDDSTNLVVVANYKSDGTLLWNKTYETYQSNYTYGITASYWSDKHVVFFKTNGTTFYFQKYTYSGGNLINQYLTGSTSGQLNFPETITDIRHINIEFEGRHLIQGKTSSGKTKFYGFEFNTVNLVMHKTMDKDLSDYLVSTPVWSLSKLDTSSGKIHNIYQLEWIHNNRTL